MNRRPACRAIALLTATDEASLLAGLSAYSKNYDELFDEVRDRTIRNGCATKLDIGGLAAWKRLRCDTPWALSLQNLSQANVTRATAAAFGAGLTPSQRMAHLQ